MFKKSYTWIDDYINANEGKPLMCRILKELKNELEIKENTIQKLRYELKKYVRRKKKNAR